MQNNFGNLEALKIVPAGALHDLLQVLADRKPAFFPAIARNLLADPEGFIGLGARPAEWAKKLLGEHTERIITDGYAHFVTDVNRQQIEYCRRGAYLNKSYTDVFQAVYDDDEYMKYYHWGVYATTFLWHHHRRIYSMCKNRFCSALAPDARGIEFGSGSGIWSTSLSTWRPDLKLRGVDISKSSLAVAQGLAEAADAKDRVTFEVGDAIKWQSGRDFFDFGISCFLLEHLEDPAALVANLRRSVKPGAPVFLTAAITAAEVDHIFEFRSEGEVIKLVEDGGFRVSEMICPPPDSTVRMEYMPRSIAIIGWAKSKPTW